MSIYLIIVIIVAVYLLCGFISKIMNNKLKKYDCCYCDGSLFFVPLCNLGCIFCRLTTITKSKNEIKEKKAQIEKKRFIAEAKAAEEATKERLKHIIQL